MKKIMMLLMVSVFFLMGGENMVQGSENSSVAEVITFPTFITAFPGQTVSITFNMIGDVFNERDYVISLWFQPSGRPPMELIRIVKEGTILFRHPMVIDRITISYDKFRKKGIVTISNVIFENEGIYYISVVDGTNMWYWSYGTLLTVSTPWARKE